MTIRQKFIVVVTLLNTLTVIACATIFWQLKQVEHEYNATLDNALPLLESLRTLEEDFSQQMSAVQNVLLDVPGAERNFNALEQDKQQILQSLEATADTKESQALIKEVIAAHNAFLQDGEATMALYKDNKQAEALQNYVMKVTEHDATINEVGNRLSEAIIEAYKKTKGKPISFKLMHECYTNLQPKNEQEKVDSVKAVLNQLIRSNLFDEIDSVDVIISSYIIKIDKFLKNGPVRKAII